MSLSLLLNFFIRTSSSWSDACMTFWNELLYSIRFKYSSSHCSNSYKTSIGICNVCILLYVFFQFQFAIVLLVHNQNITLSSTWESIYFILSMLFIFSKTLNGRNWTYGSHLKCYIFLFLKVKSKLIFIDFLDIILFL